MNKLIVLGAGLVIVIAVVVIVLYGGLLILSFLFGPEFMVEFQVAMDTDKAKGVAESNLTEAIDICKNIYEEDIGDRDGCLFSVAKHLTLQDELNSSYKVCEKVEGRGFYDKADCKNMIIDIHLNSNKDKSCDDFSESFLKEECYHYLNFEKKCENVSKYNFECYKFWNDIF